MSLRLLPDAAFPITARQFEPLMENVVQLNIIDKGLSEGRQRALSILFHTYDLFLKTGGKANYIGVDGRERLKEDAAIFCGEGNPTATRHGDLAAAHLAIDYHDTQNRLKAAGMSPLPSSVDELIQMCIDMADYPTQLEKRVGLLMDWMGKRKNV